ncbi:tegument protein UL7 [bovine alphaherpesvirus 1]|uniref:Tegument protein UL7 n=1 Tax=Bovine herpesvirus 1 TaxID=10320 RepID=A0A0U2UMU5_BHV1|nr:UL7 protein [Bovine herpesvirus type 1.1]ALR87819.1 tegument protein UL7 [Bovine alphaherpesvirus 1]AFV53412.1 UL7 protein [Bovine herpesvirus type 1.1]AVM39200.1 cytoplasmic envelopment protein 1 [Bovine alphaherpesvirus 1]AVM39424.1 cytoplasmic envelopment protein 1 [Bovine alphaherpesvirus 1]AVM39497.1 cytoplasmic envelopment protein 1 [Bovine alphaherpesvirus 1]
MAEAYDGLTLGVPLEGSTLESLLQDAREGSGGPPQVLDDLVWNALPRFVCEVREIPAGPPTFTSSSITHLRVEPSTGALLLTLDGRAEEVDCDAYRAECEAMPAFRGFAFAVLTAMEDAVFATTVPAAVLPYRLALCRPKTREDFALCVVQMFLEGCSEARVGAALFVQLSCLLRRLRPPPARKMSRLLYVGAMRVLNTAMCMAGYSPFDSQLVLPHYAVARLLLAAGNPPSVITAIYHTGGAARRGGPAPERCPPGVINARPGLLNGPLAAQAFRDAVYHWWTRIPDKLTPDKMFVSYD